MNRESIMRPRRPGLADPAIVLVALGLIACGAADPTITISLDQADLQTRLDRAFPYDTTRARTRVLLENPEVRLDSDADRVGLSLDALVDPPMMDEITARAAFSGSVRYERDDAALYLDDLRITDLQVGELSPENAERLRAVAEPVIRGALRVFPVYRLERRTLGEHATEYVLRSVVVRDGRLLVEIGLPRARSPDEPAPTSDEARRE